MKNIRKVLILLLTFLVLLTVGCSKGTEQATGGGNESKDNYKKLTGKLISQGVFEVEDIKGYRKRGANGEGPAKAYFGKGKSIEFLNDKDIIVLNQKLKYEWIDNEKICITYPSNNATSVYKFSYNNGVFRLYDEEVYVDFVKEGTAYTAEKLCLEDKEHPAIDVARGFLTNIQSDDIFFKMAAVSNISPKLKDKLIGQVSDKRLQNSKVKEALEPLIISARELNMKDFDLDSQYAIKEKSDNKAVIEVYANNKLFKTLDLEFIDSKWEIAAIN